MNQYVVDTKIKDGYLTLQNLPFAKDADVKVIVIQKIDYEKLSFNKVRELTKSIKSSLSDDVIEQRNK